MANYAKHEKTPVVAAKLNRCLLHHGKSMPIEGHTLFSYVYRSTLGHAFPSTGGKIMLALAKKFSSFHSINDMDTITKKFKHLIRGMVPRSIMTMIDHLTTHSTKLKGVSFGSYSYMAHMTGLSIPTLKRAIKRLTELGFIQVIRVWAGGHQRANIYIIQNQIDWHHVADSLISHSRIKYIDHADHADDRIQEDTHVDTLANADKPNKIKRSWRVPVWGSSKQALKNLKKDIYINDTYPIGSFPLWNWLTNTPLE